MSIGSSVNNPLTCIHHLTKTYIMEISIIILALVAGVFVGYRAVMRILKKRMGDQLTFQHDYIEKLKEANSYWAEQASYNKQTQNAAITNHNSNMNQTLTTVTKLLQTLSQQEKDNLSTENKERINKIISQAKQIIPTNSASHEHPFSANGMQSEEGG